MSCRRPTDGPPGGSHGVAAGQLLDKWLDFASQWQHPRTVYEDRSKIDSRTRPVLGDMRLDELEPDTLDGAYRMWLEQGLSPSPVRRYHAILSAACRQAVGSRWIDRAPADRSTPPQPVRKEMLVASPRQRSVMVKTADDEDPVPGTAVALAALTGARRGELVALRWSDVDLVVGSMRKRPSASRRTSRHSTGVVRSRPASSSSPSATSRWK